MPGCQDDTLRGQAIEAGAVMFCLVKKLVWASEQESGQSLGQPVCSLIELTTWHPKLINRLGRPSSKSEHNLSIQFLNNARSENVQNLAASRSAPAAASVGPVPVSAFQER